MNDRRNGERCRDKAATAAIVELVHRPGAWTAPPGGTGIEICTRARLARNLFRRTFPDWAEDEERRETCVEIREALGQIERFQHAWFLNLETLRPLDLRVLVERHLISPEMAAARAGSAVMLTRDEQVSVMINEEDHIRLQVLGLGAAPEETWRQADALDDALASVLDFAFDTRLGYLTACPSNVGTGLRVSVMVHLPALCLLREVEAVIRGLECLGLVVRGVRGEGTEARGNLFQISNASSLGETESELIQRFFSRIQEVIRHEQHARERLLEEQRAYVTDQVARALGILTHARLLPSPEAVDLLSGVRLGVELGLIEGISVSDVNAMMLLTQPAHLQIISGVVCRSERRDRVRAEMVRARLRSARMADHHTV